MEDKIKRIHNYISFLKATRNFMIWTGVGFLVVGVMIYFFSGRGLRHLLWSGMVIVGCILLFKSLYYKKHLQSYIDFTSISGIDHEQLELKKRVAFFSLALIICFIGSIIIVLISQFRYLLPAFIPIILYTAIEYIVNALIYFRLSVLRQEIFKE